MQLPSSLVQLAHKRIEPFDCEGFLPGAGPADATIMFVGEAPGETEIHNGIPFSGRAGVIFDSYLEDLNIKRDDIYVTSAVRSRPFKWGQTRAGVRRKYNRTPNQKEIQAHAPVLDYEISQVQPQWLVPMGKIAYQRLLGKSPRLGDVTGRIQTSPVRRWDEEAKSYDWTKENYNIFPIYHPAAILYNRSLEQTMKDYLNTLAAHALHT